MQQGKIMVFAETMPRTPNFFQKNKFFCPYPLTSVKNLFIFGSFG